MRHDPYGKLEQNRSFPFTIKRRDKLVARIMEETGIGKYEATIAYRIATSGLIGKAIVTEERTEQADE